MLELTPTTQLDPLVATERSAHQQTEGSTLSVSVVIPCFNEERFIGQVLEQLASQYNHDEYEIVVVDGMSTDRTREVISQFAAANPDVRVRLVNNPARNIPTALNLGIEYASGEVIARMDAHSVPSENYVRRCVEILRDEDVAVVGMPWRIQPGADTVIARSIALAVSHPFGIGDAKYRLPATSGSQLVDTVPFGAFRKSLWRQLGGFNEELLANEDYDFNYRVRQRGGQVLLDGSGHCAYFARATLKELASQYVRYGRWKAQMVKLHPRSIKLRHLVAPGFVLSLMLTSVVGWWWTPAWWALLLILVAYTSLALVCAVQLARRAKAPELAAAIPLVFIVLHVAWGGSFLLGLLRAPR